MFPSGSAWLKKRKEAREKAQKEKEEKEAQEKAEKEALESAVPASTENTLTEVEDDAEVKVGETTTISAPSTAPLSAHPTASTITDSAFPTPRASSADIIASTLGSSATLRPKPSLPLPQTNSAAPTAPSTPTISSMSPPPLSASSGHSEEDRVLKTMSIPMHRPHPHHRSRSASNATFTQPVHDTNTKVPDLVKAGSESESETDSSESESDREEDDEDDDDEEDDEEEEQRRKMVIGAGMEKVCWHRTDAVEEPSSSSS